MALLNPKNLAWQRPLKNTDGSPVTVDLDYELGIRYAEESEPQAHMSVVGDLQEGDTYSAPLDQSDLPAGAAIFISLRAINHSDDSEAPRFSAWSNEVEILFSNGIPEAPRNFTVA